MKQIREKLLIPTIRVYNVRDIRAYILFIIIIVVNTASENSRMSLRNKFKCFKYNKLQVNRLVCTSEK